MSSLSTLLVMQEHFIRNTDLFGFITRLLENARVIAPLQFGQQNILQEVTSDTLNKVNLLGFRTIETLKPYVFQISQRVAGYFGEESKAAPGRVVLLGARGCDLEGLEIQDRVYLEGDYCDPVYRANREALTIIGTDCTDCGSTCFCTMVGGKPYPTKLYDLNFSPVKDGYVVEVGTEKGEKIIKENQRLFAAPGEKDKEQVKADRQKRIELLGEQNKDYALKLDLSETHKKNLENKVWKKLAKDCVECSACNFACPTCSCFLLLDSKLNTHHSRHKIWDACLKAGYARVAGGANSRPKLFERLQNRYHCKFDYSYDRLGRYACVGCGRCIDGCAGKIDMREVYVELVKQVPLTAKLE